jgi:hypothetical protein
MVRKPRISKLFVLGNSKIYCTYLQLLFAKVLRMVNTCTHRVICRLEGDHRAKRRISPIDKLNPCGASEASSVYNRGLC